MSLGAWCRGATARWPGTQLASRFSEKVGPSGQWNVSADFWLMLSPGETEDTARIFTLIPSEFHQVKLWPLREDNRAMRYDPETLDLE